MSIPPSLNSPAYHHPNGPTPLVSPSNSIAFSDSTSNMDSYPFTDFSNTEPLNPQWYNQEFIGSGVLQPQNQASAVNHHNSIPQGQYTQSIQQHGQQQAIVPPAPWAITSAESQNATIWRQEQQQQLLANTPMYPLQIQQNRHNTVSAVINDAMALDQLEQHYSVAPNKFISHSSFSPARIASPALRSPNLQHQHQHRPTLSQIRHHSTNSTSTNSTQPIPSPNMPPSLLNNLQMTKSHTSPPQSMLHPPSKPPVRRTQSSPIAHASHPSTPSVPQSPTNPPSTTSLPKRKRGRPRLQRPTPTSPPASSSTVPTSTTSKSTGAGGSSSVSKLSRRQPHNMVERKYREGLNNEMERLRATLPHLHKTTSSSTSKTKSANKIKTEDADSDSSMNCGDDEAGAAGEAGTGGKGSNQRPSKAIVLQSAVEEIERLRGENGRLKGEVERLVGERDRLKGEVEGVKMGFGRR